MKETHHIYTQENEANLIGLSKLCELCPANIKLFDKIPQNVCVCLYHKNVHLLLLELEKFTYLSASFSQFLSQIKCDESKECMYIQCGTCENNLGQCKSSSEPQQMPIKYSQWQTMNRRAEKFSITATVGDIFEERKSQTNYFLIHRYVKKNASCAYEEGN